MARIRTIKPSFFTSLTIDKLPLTAQRTFIGLWTYADDRGRGIDDARLIKAAIWPLVEKHTIGKVEKDLELIAGVGLIVRYEVDGLGFFEITAWAEHQRVNRPQPSPHPPPPLPDDALHVHVTISDDAPPEGKGREGKEPPTPAREQRGQPQNDAIKTRFLSYVDQESAAPCWLWTGTTKSKGYGLFWVGGKNAAAHRWAYEAFVEPIPEGLQIHHECSNPGCVNPAHLKPVTNAENARQTKSERTQRTHCLKGHAFTSETTYVSPDGQRRCRTCYNDWWRRQYGNGGSKRTEGKNPRALGTNPRKVAEREAEERRQRQAGCQTCDGMGVVPTDDDGAIPCPDCREVKAS